jgi:flagellar biogenesis protein FliO
MSYNELKLKNSNEIVNKYSKPNDNVINRDNNESNNNKSSSVPVALIVILIIIFVLFVLYLAYRFYRKRNLSKMNDYFINDYPNTN